MARCSQLRLMAVLILLGVLASGMALSAASPAVAAPDGGLAASSNVRYVVDVKAREVRASTELTITNQRPNQGNVRYYFNAYYIYVPAGATKVRASSNGSMLPVDRESIPNDPGTFARVQFPGLYYGQTRTIRWDYTMPGAKIRSKKSDVRVGDGYAVFQAVGVGDDTTVEIVGPSAMEFDASDGPFIRKETGKSVTWTASDIGVVGVSLRDQDKNIERTVSVGDTDVVIQAFPGDEEWLDFAERNVTEAVPVLERIIGETWPGELDVIREDTSSEATGYAWFDSDEREIVVSERLDTLTLYHELTHAWINHDTSVERWVVEGLTEFIAVRAARETGVKHEPRKTPNRKGSEAFPLTEWKSERGTRDGYAYPAAYAAVTAMLEGLDEEQLTALVSDLHQGRTAYDGPEDEGYQDGGAVWGTFRDLAVKHGVDPDVDQLLKTWVLTRGQAKQLAIAKKARASYGAIDEADGGWMPPRGLRDAMAYWNFEDAATIRDLAEDAAEAAGKLQDSADEAGLPASMALREAYETANVASEYGDVATGLTAAADATTEVGEASAAVEGFDGPLTEIGELMLRLDAVASDARSSLDDGETERAVESAELVETRSRWALAVGIVTVLILVGMAYGLVRFVRWTTRRSRARRWKRRRAREPIPDVPVPEAIVSDEDVPGGASV